LEVENVNAQFLLKLEEGRRVLGEFQRTTEKRCQESRTFETKTGNRHPPDRELSEIRKMGKLVTQAKLAFEQIELRINTIRDMGDIAASLSPAVGIIRGIAPGLYNILPEAQSEIGEISGLLSGILVDAGQMSYGSINFETANGEAEKILAEAGAVAEQNMQDRFPDLPASIRNRDREDEELA
jgi:hypothetical protein